MAAPRLTASRTAPRPAWGWSLTAFWGAAVARGQPHWVSPHFLDAVPSKAEDTLGCELHSGPHPFPDPLRSLLPPTSHPLHRAGHLAHLRLNLRAGWMHE